MKSLRCFLGFHDWVYGAVQEEHVIERDPGSGCLGHEGGKRHFEAVPIRQCRRCLILEGYDLPEGSRFEWDDWDRYIVKHQDSFGFYRGGSWLIPKREEVLNAIRTMLVWDEFDKKDPAKWAEEQIRYNKHRGRIKENG